MISEIDFVFLSDHSIKDCIGGQYIEGLVCPAHFFSVRNATRTDSKILWLEKINEVW